MSIKVAVHIDPAKAIRMGRSQSGNFMVELTLADIEALTVEQRQILAESGALASRDAVPGSRCTTATLDATEPTFAGVLEGIEQLKKDAERRKRQALEAQAKEQQALLDKISEAHEKGPEYFVTLRWPSGGSSYYDTICDVNPMIAKDETLIPLVQQAKAIVKSRNDEKAAEKQARIDAEEKARRDAIEQEARFKTALAAFIMEHGEEHHRERCIENALPEDEAVAFLRGKLFEPFDALKRFDKITEAEVLGTIPARHMRVGGDLAYIQRTDVSFSHEPVTQLPNEQWVKFKQIRAIVESMQSTAFDITMSARIHRGFLDVEGPNLSSYKVVRYSCLVTITWNGRPFSRALALYDAPETPSRSTSVAK